MVDQKGNIEGLDGDVTVITAKDATVTTTGDGKATINGRAYTVSGDGNGVTYTAADTGVASFSGLKKGASIKLEGAFTGTSITDTDVADNGSNTAVNFTGIHSVDGITLTKNSAGDGYDVTLDKADEAVTIDTNTYKVNSTSDGITVDSKTGKVSGLTNGDKVSIIDSTNAVVTYEVVDGILTVTDTDGKTATYKQADSSTPFTATYAAGTGEVTEKLTITGQSTDREETAKTDGLKIGNSATTAGEVNTVTNGMLVDKNGNATTDTSKATAKLTITDSGDAIKYEAQTNNAQAISATTGKAATMEWDVTTGSGADNIEITSTKDSIIDAGDGKNSVTVGSSGNTTVKTGSGNDTILINGTGEALVEVAGGNNKITHTGTGESTLKGGSGNDTFKSNNENDTIVFGDGSNTLKMTANVTNTISDYEFGKDKLNTAAYTGTLALDDINVGTDGTIGYGTTEGTAKVGNDGQSVYAATLADADGRNKRNVGWTGAEGGMINATGQTERVVLIGNAEGAHDTLMGGQAGDTLKAGTGASSLWGGAGNDVIISSSTDSNEIFFLAGDGKDTVQGFTAYTEATAETADVLDFYGQGATDIKMTSQGLKIYNGESSMLVSGTYDADTMFRWKGNTGDAVRVAKIGYQDTANTMTYEDAATDYIGGKGIDTINATGGEVNLWMDGSRGKSFGNIEVINAAGNTENVTIAGGEGKNTLVGGTGDASLWGGVGSADDVLIGNGQTDFFYNMGGGNDSIAGHSGDTVDLFDMQLSDFTGIELDTANRRVILSTTAGHNVTISGGVDTFKVGGQTWTTSYASGSDWTLKE